MAGQIGNTNAARAKEFRDALDFALKNYKGIKKGLALREIATKLIKAALDGNMSAITMIADRLDGKPAQDITGTLTHIHDASEISTDELYRIATGGSKGAAKKAGSAKKADSVH